MTKKIFILILTINAIILYILGGIVFNPLIIFVLLPFYIGYAIVLNSWKIKSTKKLWGGYVFLIASIGFSYFYHIEWFLDLGSMKTGSSTSALIFLAGPIMAVIIGYIGYFVGIFLEGILTD